MHAPPFLVVLKDVTDGAEHVPKARAWELLGKYLMLFSDKREQSGNVTLIVQSAIPGSPGSLSQHGVIPEGALAEIEG